MTTPSDRSGVPLPVAAGRRTPRNPGFERLWFGTAASNLADGVLVAAAPLLATTITHDPVLVAGLVVAQRLPWLVFTLISGALVDRIDRRVLLVAANWGRAAALGLLAVSLAADVRNLGVLYATVFVLGIAETIEDTAALAVLPALVARDQLERANGRIYATQSVFNELVGPPIGGALFAAAAVAAFAAGSVAFAVAALALATVPLARQPQPDTGYEPIIAAIRGGFGWFWRNRLIRAVALMSGAVNMFTFAALSVLVLVAQQRLGLDATGYGVLLAGAAVGGVVGGLLADRIVNRLGSGRAIFVSNLMPAFAFLVIAMTHSPVVAGVMLSVDTFASTIGIVVVVTLRQAAVPDELMGRVTSAYRMIALGGLPLGALLGGVLARVFTLTTPFYFAAAGLAAIAVGLLPVLTTEAIDTATGKRTPVVTGG